jgi:hypothetical protein
MCKSCYHICLVLDLVSHGFLCAKSFQHMWLVLVFCVEVLLYVWLVLDSMPGVLLSYLVSLGFLCGQFYNHIWLSWFSIGGILLSYMVLCLQSLWRVQVRPIWEILLVYPIRHWNLQKSSVQCCVYEGDRYLLGNFFYYC